MITEFRRLIFSSSELVDAIKTFSKEKVAKLPEGDIVGMVIVSEPHICAQVHVADTDGNSEEQEIVVDAKFLAAAMVYLCMQSSIPIPRLPKKILERAGDGLALSFSINADPQLIEDINI